MTSVIDKALARASTYTSSSQRDDLVAEGVHLRALLDGLLPIEEAARTTIEERIEEVKTTIRRIDVSQELEGLPILDQDVFAWTKPQQAWKKAFGWDWIEVPALAYIPVDEDRCRLAVDWRRITKVNGHSTRHGTKSDLPEQVDEHYRAIMSRLGGKHLRVDGREQLMLTYTYPGIVPAEIKEIIKTETPYAGKGRFDRLAFVCDVDRWQVGVREVPREHRDPILVGEKAGALWVLATFDPTPVEEYLAAEFTS